jgi:Fur family ferric uptake transcriptional regulator
MDAGIKKNFRRPKRKNMIEQMNANKKCGTRMTRQRKVILEELRKNNIHPSADEVYEMVRKRLPRISLGTVYRNLELLSEQGKIQKIEHAGSMKRFDGNPQKHYHIRCMNCDRLVDAPFDFLGDIEKKLGKSTDYKVMGHQLEFIGLCPDCFDKAASRW